MTGHDRDRDLFVNLRNLESSSNDQVESLETHNLDDLFPRRIESNRYYQSNDKERSSNTYSFTTSSDSQQDSEFDGEELESISSSILPVSLSSTLIRDLINTSDKDQLRSEINGIKDRKYFTNLFRENLNLKESHQDDDFANYDRQLKIETYLRNKTKKFLTQNSLPYVNKSYTIDIKRGELDDTHFIAGHELTNQKSKFNFIKRLNPHSQPSKLYLKQKESDPVELNNMKSFETNVIDDNFNYNIPIDHQDYNRLIQDRSEKLNYTEYEEVQALNSWESQQYQQQPPSRKHNYEIQRKLKTRHLTMIAFGGTLGVGLFLASGKLFSIAGPLGTLLGFMISGSTVLATMLSFCEMVTLIPLAGGVSGISARFVEDAFGFALGVSYWFNYMIGLPTEITLLTIMLSYYDNILIPGKSTAGFVTLFLGVVIAINLCDIRVYGEIEYYSSLLKLLVLFALIIFNIILNRGGVPPYHNFIGFRYWDSSQSQPENNITYGPFRPTFDLHDNGLGSMNGIGGARGRFLSVLIASVISLYSFIGTEILLIAGGELKSPRKLIPKSSKAIYWRILLFYLVGIFVIGLNIYSGDPRLLRYFSSDNTQSQDGQALIDTVIEANGGTTCNSKLLEYAGFANGNQSPWVIALQSAGLCGFSSAFNGFLVYFALSAGSSQLYASSRTLYYLSIQGKLPKVFGICNNHGVPYISVIFTGMFGALAYLTVNNNTARVFQIFLNLCSSFGLVVWGGMNLSFIRFFYGLKLRPDIIGRNEIGYPYRSPFQPYLLYFGLFLSVFLIVSNGIVIFLGNWSVTSFFSSYGSVIVMIVCYLSYKILRRTKIHRLDQLDLDSGRREIDRIIWEDNKNYHSNFKELLKKVVDYVA